MVCFDRKSRIRKYASVNDILREFCDVRKEYYQKRKAHLLQQMTFDLTRLENKVRFISEIISGSLIVQNRKRVDLMADLRSRGYEPIYKGQTSASTSVDEEDSEASDQRAANGYDYLLGMSIWSLTQEKVTSFDFRSFCYQHI
jgi:DNA topoisomerase-2